MRFDLQSFCKLADGPHLRLHAISFYAVYRRRSDPGFLGQLDLTQSSSEPQPFEVLPYVYCPRHDKSLSLYVQLYAIIIQLKETIIYQKYILCDRIYLLTKKRPRQWSLTPESRMLGRCECMQYAIGIVVTIIVVVVLLSLLGLL